MRENLVVSARGQITLPAALRKRFGIESGDVIIIEEREGELVLRPAVVLEVEAYTDEQIARWDKEDLLRPGERKRILKRLARDK